MDPNALKNIEDLHRLKNEGIISEEEFERSKQRLLFDTRPISTTAAGIARSEGLPALDDHIGWITLPVRRYADFNGRSGRKEFWMFQLLYLAILVVMAFALAMSGRDENGSMSGLGVLTMGLSVLALLGLVVPLIAAEARRFHDQNRSGWLTLINLIPYAGAAVVLIFMLLPGTEGDNSYGPDPRQG